MFKKVLGVTAVFAMAIGLYACGGDDDPAANAPSTTDVQNAASATPQGEFTETTQIENAVQGLLSGSTEPPSLGDLLGGGRLDARDGIFQSQTNPLGDCGELSETKLSIDLACAEQGSGSITIECEGAGLDFTGGFFPTPFGEIDFVCTWTANNINVTDEDGTTVANGVLVQVWEDPNYCVGAGGSFDGVQVDFAIFCQNSNTQEIFFVVQDDAGNVFLVKDISAGCSSGGTCTFVVEDETNEVTCTATGSGDNFNLECTF